MPRNMYRLSGPALLVLLAACLLLAGPLSRRPPQPATPSFDVVIRNGHIIDGTGSPWYSGDIGIRGGQIAAIGNLAGSSAGRIIDAKGMVVAPGFIDMLGQSELTILVDPRLPSKIYQGITTEITGEGDSVAPLDPHIIAENRLAYAHLKLTPTWRDFRGYFARLQKQGMGINLASYVGATSVRRMVIGETDRAATPAELDRMEALVVQAMQQGAQGLSTALEYAPAPYASTNELIALARVASSYGGIYATHMRNEGDGIFNAVDETLRISREARIPVEIFHLKVAGVRNWGHMPQLVARIDAARAAGTDVTADTYAYTAWENDMSAFIPPWAHEGGVAKLIARLRDPATRVRIRKDMLTPSAAWDNEWEEIPGPSAVLITAVQNPALVPLQGKRLSDIAKLWREDPMDALFDLIIKDNAFTSVADFGMSEPDVELALKQPWVSIDNDASGASPTGLLGQEHPHPRAYGTFPRILRKYVRGQKLVSLPEAIRKFSAMPAARLRLAGRGVLKKGMWADVVVFDPSTIHDVATYENPNQLSVGMEYVLVNGVPVIDAGKMTGKLPGRVLYGPGYGRASPGK
ncbi:MAG TPA: D-aminoacylase [Candidatus Acidoferrales bacterium]|nr:D-aminoacylase [Candidatus Acidoferrales bacterium]